MTKSLNILLLIVTLLTTTTSLARQMKNITQKEVVDAYQYLMGRVLILRQEHIDFQKEGFKWNEMIHRDVGGVQWANPNLDVAYSEAWVAIDKDSCTMVEIPEIKGRYYTVQFLNGWGETTANINDRNYPKHAFGKFAMCLKDSTVKLAPDVQKIILPSKKSRVLARIELGADTKEAVALQKQMKMYPTGKPEISESPKVVEFEHKTPPGIEVFDNASAILASEKDINPNMGGLQRKVIAVEASAKNDKTREATAKLVREKAIPEFLMTLEKMQKHKNGWGMAPRHGNYGADYISRTGINYGGIWANNSQEAVYYTAMKDTTNTPLNGSTTYSITFPKGKMPADLARYFWSIVCVDTNDFKVIPNPDNKFVINNQTGAKPNPDGSLTLYFSSKMPQGVAKENWLPTPAGGNYNLTFRFYGPKKELQDGKYFPPALVKQPSLAKLEDGSTY
ncbi:DUF1214 domain-containing protein [Bdellovibrio sp. HCB209]|uniref:DUF1214 domain-containing protein n=1 Tax=Bdellovibrio sp. HCB209 TaxID=3394354 RepID=UPI0039B3BCAD